MYTKKNLKENTNGKKQHQATSEHLYKLSKFNSLGAHDLNKTQWPAIKYISDAGAVNTKN